MKDSYDWFRVLVKERRRLDDAGPMSPRMTIGPVPGANCNEIVGGRQQLRAARSEMPVNLPALASFSQGLLRFCHATARMHEKKFAGVERGRQR